MDWFDLHPKVKAALVTLAVLAAGGVVAVVQGSVSAQDAAKAFVVAAVPVLVAYLKSSTGVEVVLPDVTVDPALDGDDTKTGV